MATDPVDDDLARLQADQATVDAGQAAVDADIAQLAKDRAAENQPAVDVPIVFGTAPVLWNGINWVRL